MSRCKRVGCKEKGRSVYAGCCSLTCQHLFEAGELITTQAILWLQTKSTAQDPFLKNHPLTCGNDSEHGLLYYYDGKLKCHDCEYTQAHIPGMVYKTFIDFID